MKTTRIDTMFQPECVYRFPQFDALLKNNIVDAMLNPVRKKRVIVDVMLNSVHRKINSFRSRCHALMASKH
jgi:hypothetical protein